MSNNRYYDNFNPDLFNEIPNNLSKILELGCGAGALGERYKSFNPCSHWCGLELIEEQANRAKDKLDRVFCIDIENSFPIIQDEQFDALIIGDVLEHLKDPWTVLKNSIALLSDFTRAIYTKKSLTNKQ